MSALRPGRMQVGRPDWSMLPECSGSWYSPASERHEIDWFDSAVDTYFKMLSPIVRFTRMHEDCANSIGCEKDRPWLKIHDHAEC